MKNPIIYLALCLCLLCFANQVKAYKTDIIILQNGDRITGEIKGLISGQLELSTEYMDTVYIDWENIRDIISEQGQQIEMADGQRVVGTLDKPQTNRPEDADLIIINTDEGAMEVTSFNLVRMYPVGGSFWDRMDLTFSLGFNFDKSSGVGKYNLGVNAIYRDPEFISFANLSSELTSQNDVDNTVRNVLGVDHLSYRPNKRYRSYFGSVEQNDQLGIDLRTLLGLGSGWVPISTSRNWLSLGVGMAGNWEKPFDGSDSDTNLEAVGFFRYQYYKQTKPKRTLDINFKVFPSITQWGRVRADLTVDAEWEIISDFYIGLQLYTSYDGEPAAEDAESIDYGIRSTVGYKF